MSDRILHRAVVAVLLAALALPAPGALVRAAIPAAVGPCVAGWREVPVPDAAFISTPFEVLTHEGEPAWIAGGSNTGILALRWNGSAWKRAATASTGHRGLVGGEALGSDRLLAVGYFRADPGEGEGSLRPISGRVVESTWRERPVPDQPGPRATLTDVAALPGGQAIAVGTRLASGRLRAWAVRWDGARWVRRAPSGGSGSGLLAVERSPSVGLWAVGWRESGLGRPRPSILKRAEGRWRRVDPAGVAAGSAALTDVDFAAADDGLAVGYLARRGTDRHTPILQHWDGDAWSRLELPWANDFSGLPRSVSMGAGGKIWIAGTQLANDRREARGFIAGYDGSAWEVDVLDVPADVRSEVMDVAATASGALAVANVGASLLVLESCTELALAAGGQRHQVRVGEMRARREAKDDDGHARDVTPAEHAGSSETGLYPAAATGGISLATPVRPKGFHVKDMAAASGLKQWTKTYAGFAADLDGNGEADVFYSRHGGVLPRLALNTAGAFSNASGGAFSPVDRHGCDVGDVNRDGDRDILCAVGASRGKSIQRHELSLAPGTPSRQLVTGVAGIADPLGRGRLVALIKLDDDGWPEVFIGNAPDRDDGMPSYNRFYRNEGGTFVPAPSVGLDSSHGAICAVARDIDGDGDEDLAYCTHYGFGDRPAGLRLMRNEGGELRDRSLKLGVRPMGDIDVAFADVTGDGRRDLIQLGGSRLRVSTWTKRGYRKAYEANVPNAWALAAGDASGDGLADIYIVRGTDRANKADRLLISHDRGRRFRSVRIPQVTKGSADDVFALDYDRNGHTDFVVLNGRLKPGPVQLLAAFPR